MRARNTRAAGGAGGNTVNNLMAVNMAGGGNAAHAHARGYICNCNPHEVHTRTTHRQWRRAIVFAARTIKTCIRYLVATRN